MSSKQYLIYIQGIFSSYGDFTYRAMFGGYGIYKNKVIFAIILNNEIYFKVDDSNKQQYLNYNSAPFSYNKNGKSYNMSYWKLPIEIFEDEESLPEWIEQSYQISLNKK